MSDRDTPLALPTGSGLMPASVGGFGCTELARQVDAGKLLH